MRRDILLRTILCLFTVLLIPAVYMAVPAVKMYINNKLFCAMKSCASYSKLFIFAELSICISVFVKILIYESLVPGQVAEKKKHMEDRSRVFQQLGWRKVSINGIYI